MWLSPMRKDYLSKLSKKKCFHQFVNILCLKFCLIITIRHKTTSGFPFGKNFTPFQVSWRESYCDQSDFPKRSLKYLSSKLSAQLRWRFTRIIDLLQVDLLASGASLFWPRSGRPRATKSREVVLRPRHMKSDEGLYWKSTRITVVWAWVPCRLYFHQLNHCCKICIYG